MSSAELVLRLSEALGADAVLTGERLALRQTRDWSEAPAASPIALLLPRDTAAVATALRLCHAHGAAVVVQGGLTGLAGGANPQPGEVALSLSRMDRIEELDAEAGTALVQAGVTLEQLQEACAGHGWTFALDLGARGSCQLGGNAATNAGGSRVLRHGMMRNLVLGLEVVLCDGTVLGMLDRVIKNNAGFDLKQLFIGSEGTLGVITRLSLMLSPRPAQSCTALCGVASLGDSLKLLRLAKASLPGLSAFELMWDGFFQASLRAQGRSSPLGDSHPVYVLLEAQVGAGMDAAQALEDFLARALEAGLVADAVLAQSAAQHEALWALREGVAELLAHAKPCAAFDVSVALTRMEALVDRLSGSLHEAFPALQHLFFGHLGDGNLHLISGPYADEAERARAEDLVYACVGRFEGSVSAEHGIGTVKRAFVHHSRGAAELALMRQLKASLDPKGILNRGRVVPEPGLASGYHGN